jgi:membrane protease YdiL (CAAX protease family)
MLFYTKRHLWLEIMVTILLASVGLWGIDALNLPLRAFKGSAFAEQLTASLAKEYANPSSAQILLGGVTAACGEEIFFRGFVQQWLGLAVASLLFMVAHFGKKDIRVASYWLIFQGLYLGLFFAYSKNLIVPMIAHGLFDMGGMIYFRGFMSRLQKKQV